MLTNVDQYFKYIAPTFTVYINTSGAVARDNGTFFYCLQGTRELMRYLYLRNRLNYVDSKWHAGTYAVEAAKQEFWSRFDANLMVLTSDNTIVTDDPDLLALGSEQKTITLKDGTELQGVVHYVEESAYPTPLDAVADFNGFTPYLQQYVSILHDDVYYEPVRYDGKTPLNLTFNQTVTDRTKTELPFTQQLVYFGGGEYIADLGDLSKKYFDELKLARLKRLKRLQLGSDIPGYFNSQLTQDNFQIGANKYNASGEWDYMKYSLYTVAIASILRQAFLEVKGYDSWAREKFLNAEKEFVNVTNNIENLPKNNIGEIISFISTIISCISSTFCHSNHLGK